MRGRVRGRVRGREGERETLIGKAIFHDTHYRLETRLGIEVPFQDHMPYQDMACGLGMGFQDMTCGLGMGPSPSSSVVIFSPQSWIPSWSRMELSSWNSSLTTRPSLASL